MLSDLVQGAPYPGDDIKSELYTIWYEHAQRAAVECFEFLDANFILKHKELSARTHQRKEEKRDFL